MSECSLLRYLYLAYLSHPAPDRLLYRGLRQWRSRSIVELGISGTLRTRRMLEIARRYAGSESVRYTGIDLFEARPSQQAGLSLKQAHQQLQFVGARVQLAPGDPWMALVRLANTLVGTDLLIVSADVDQESLARAWFFVPRMLHQRSQILVEQRSGEHVHLKAMPLAEVHRLAAVQQKAQRRVS